MSEQNISQKQAYEAMLVFLERLYKRTGFDDLGAVLGGLMLLKDGRPADPAALSDWDEAINAVLERPKDEAG